MKRSIFKVVLIVLRYYLLCYSECSCCTIITHFSTCSTCLSTRCTCLFTCSTRLFIRLSTRSTRLSTHSICLSTGSICLSTRSTQSTFVGPFITDLKFWYFLNNWVSNFLEEISSASSPYILEMKNWNQ